MWTALSSWNMEPTNWIIVKEVQTRSWGLNPALSVIQELYFEVVSSVTVSNAF